MTDDCKGLGPTQALTESVKQEIRAKVERCRYGRNACLDALQIVTRHYGWISDACLSELAVFLGMTPDELDSTASFYNHVYRRPVGRHMILVCDSVSCWIMGYEGMRAYLTQRLGINLGETTQDGRFTLLPIACLGACDRAPAMMVDDDLYCRLDAEEIDRILTRYE